MILLFVCCYRSAPSLREKKARSVVCVGFVSYKK